MRSGPVPFATLNVYSESGRVSSPAAAIDISQKHYEVPGLSEFG